MKETQKLQQYGRATRLVRRWSFFPQRTIERKKKLYIHTGWMPQVIQQSSRFTKSRGGSRRPCASANE